MGRVTREAPDWSALAASIEGEVVRPGTPGYDDARRPAVPALDQPRPAAVLRCQGPGDVAAVVEFARRFGVPVAVRSGGHCFGGRSSTPGIVLDVSAMRSVEAGGDVATIGGGTRLGEVYDTLAARGRTVPAGCGPTVGISGLTLGGGLGILGRTYGLTCDNLLAAEVVLADGRVVRCDDEHEAELFWALRGAGGGGFGVVTSMVFRTFPAPTSTGFHLRWPFSSAEAVIAAWQAFAPAAPDELAASLVVRAPAERGREPTVNVFGAMTGPRSDAAGLLDELVARVGVDHAHEDLREQPYRETKRFLTEVGARFEGGPVPGTEPAPAGPAPAEEGVPFSKSEYFRRELPPDAISALVAGLVADRVEGASRELDFSPWSGAYNRRAEDATAFVHRRESFLLKQAVVVEPQLPDESRRAERAWLRQSWGIAHTWGTGGVYPNFPDLELADWARAYHGSNARRLARIKAAYDPDGFFAGPQSISPAP